MFPKIERPCPYVADIAAAMGGGYCRMCKRDVVDLSEMADDARAAFLGECRTEEVCVSYTVKLGLAAALAAVALPGVAFAQASAPLPQPTQAEPDPQVEIVEMGGMPITGPRIRSEAPVTVVTVSELRAAPKQRARRARRNR